MFLCAYACVCVKADALCVRITPTTTTTSLSLSLSLALCGRWAAGIDRLALMETHMPATATVNVTSSVVAVAVVDVGAPEPLWTALQLAAAVWRRENGPAVLLPIDGDPSDPARLTDLSKQLSRAARAGARQTLIVGPTETADGVVQVKTMADGSVRRIPLAAILAGADPTLLS
jgi:histidyl-tRNA synthetase